MLCEFGTPYMTGQDTNFVGGSPPMTSNYRSSKLLLRIDTLLERMKCSKPSVFNCLGN